MTFTTRSGVTTCDPCGTEVGPTWRARAAHICPRNVPDPFAKWCALASCRKPLVRRDNESAHTFSRRRFCGRPCATTHSRSRTVERNQP